VAAVSGQEPSRNSSGDTYCEHAGHEWVPAGGGLFVCAVCEAETWGDLDPVGYDIGEAQDALSYERGGLTS
jgi:hypothetical protein